MQFLFLKHCHDDDDDELYYVVMSFVCLYLRYVNVVFLKTKLVLGFDFGVMCLLENFVFDWIVSKPMNHKHSSD